MDASANEDSSPVTSAVDEALDEPVTSEKEAVADATDVSGASVGLTFDEANDEDSGTPTMAESTAD